MKKFIITINVLFSLILSGCFDNNEKQTTLDTNKCDDLISLMQNPVMNESHLIYTMYGSNIDIEYVNSECNLNVYSLRLSNILKNYTHTINSNIIEEKDILTNTTTTYIDLTTSTFKSVEIASLSYFSELVLDTYSEEFSYYSMKDFIPLALQLTKETTFDFYIVSESFEEGNYRLSASIDVSLIDDKIEDILESLSYDYKNLVQNNKLDIEITVKTDSDISYFKPEFIFSIFDTQLINIS